MDGGTFTVPEALSNKIIHPFGDYLLHDVGTGDGMVHTTGLQETANKIRTAPYWGLRMRTRFTHDFASLSLNDGIRRHQGEAQQVAERFRDVSPVEKQQSDYVPSHSIGSCEDRVGLGRVTSSTVLLLSTRSAEK